MNRALLPVALAFVLGGWTERPSPSPQARDFLTDAPRWSLEGTGFAPGSCFGNSFALGDVDGDGHKDLVAAVGPCSWTPRPGPGQVAIYRGTGTYFSREPVVTTLSWQNPLRNSGRNLTVSVGDVDGDRYADVLVRSQSGVQVFNGRQNLQAMFAAPTRFPAASSFQGAIFSDMNGDGLDDVLINLQGRSFTFLSTPSTPARFTLVGSIYAQEIFRAGDTNGDGAEDLLVRFAAYSTYETTVLYLGCPQGQSCYASLRPQPAWFLPGTVVSMFPDQNGDGYLEVVRSDFIGGRIALHLSNPETGVPQDAPAWSVLGDPLYVGFGRSLVTLGDMDGDGQRTEFAVSAIGRVYGYFPRDGISEELRPAFAWSGKDDPLAARHAHALTVRLPAVAANDLDGDGFEDMVVGAPPAFQADEEVGRIVVYGGGRVLPEQTGPRMPALAQCGLTSSPDGKPDVTVDGDLLARSAYIEERFFDASSCEVQEQCVNGPGLRRLLRFSVSVPNLGNAPALIPGPEEAPHLYYYDDCHKHDHLEGFASYQLHNAQDGLVTSGRKQGFQLIDYQPYCADAEMGRDHHPSMGMTPGWADIYTADLPCQWLDITDVPDGTYSLSVGVDLNNLIDENDVLPNTVAVDVHIQRNTVKVTPVGAYGPKP
jgi:hypothetical protein